MEASLALISSAPYVTTPVRYDETVIIQQRHYWKNKLENVPILLEKFPNGVA